MTGDPVPGGLYTVVTWWGEEDGDDEVSLGLVLGASGELWRTLVHDHGVVELAPGHFSSCIGVPKL